MGAELTELCAGCGYLREYHDGIVHRCTFKPRPPIDPALWPEILRRDAAARREETEAARRPYGPEVIPPPIVPARSPRGQTEFATSKRGISAAKLGAKAVGLGWTAEPYYWVTGAGAEGCAVKLAKGPLRAVAIWSRKAENVGTLTGWKTEYAYAWRTDVEGRFPTKMSITELEGLIR
jgi:hypothetical protein